MPKQIKEQVEKKSVEKKVDKKQVEAPVAVVEKKVGGKKEAAKEVPVAVPVQAKAAPKKQKGGEVASKPNRYFKCIYVNTDGEIVTTGRYSGKKPKQAACKALTGIVKNCELEGEQPVKFLMAECTRGSKKKRYSYSGHQQELETPVEVVIKREGGGEQKIVYNKHNVVKKIDKQECAELLNIEVNDDEDDVVPVKKVGGKKPVQKKLAPKKVAQKKVAQKKQPVKGAKKSG
jgi:hypothetical protein